MTTASRRRINSLRNIIDAKNYLEIGVCTGKVFNNLDFAGTKVAVDPKFRFNTAIYSNNKTQFFECTSDIFFEAFNQSAKFDIIFIDGLHTYEQTFSDICNSISLSSPESFFLIDDTLPSDIYSSFRSQKLCYESRGLHFEDKSKLPKDWHGDTYKTLFLINHYLRSYDYSTIINSGKPQTVMWRKSFYKSNIKPPYKRFANRDLIHQITENIGSIDYIKTMESFSDIFHFCEETKLIDYLSKARVK